MFFLKKKDSPFQIMGNEIVLKKKARASSSYWNRAKTTDRGAGQSYIGRFRYPNYVGKDIGMINIALLGERIGNSSNIVYPPTMDGSSYLENKRKENERLSSFLQEKTMTFYPWRRSLLHVAYLVDKKQTFPTEATTCFNAH